MLVIELFPILKSFLVDVSDIKFNGGHFNNDLWVAILQFPYIAMVNIVPESMNC